MEIVNGQRNNVYAGQCAVFASMLGQLTLPYLLVQPKIHDISGMGFGSLS